MRVHGRGHQLETKWLLLADWSYFYITANDAGTWFQETFGRFKIFPNANHSKMSI